MVAVEQQAQKVSRFGVALWVGLRRMRHYSY
jgi:hypothetical protein